MERMPALYLGHGAPPLVDDHQWVAELAQWSADLPKPQAILIISAHWESAPLAIGATTQVPLVYDFYGFPQHYYKVQYASPGAPELADKVEKLLSGIEPVFRQPQRGLDHGAYVPLTVMYPQADIPVLQISMPSLDPLRLWKVGKALESLRDEGVLIIGSGFLTHNLRLADFSNPHGKPAGWSSEFDAWVNEAIAAKDLDSVLDFKTKAPAARLAHPTTEHFAPLFVTLGMAESSIDKTRTIIDGYWYGMSKRSFQAG